MGTAANVLVGATGKIYGAPSATPLPTTPDDVLDGALIAGEQGYVSDQGVTQHIGTTVTTIKAWGGDVIRKVKSEHDLTYNFQLLETNPNSLETYYGAQDDPSNVVEIKAQNGLRQVWVIDVIDGINVVRIAIPDGEILELGDVKYATEEAIIYDVTMSCYADDTGVKAYKYVLDNSTGS